MKKNFLLIFVILFYSCGTDQGDGKTYVYTVKNATTKPIKIKILETYNPDTPAKILNLAVNEELTKTYKDGSPPGGYNFGQFFGGDSLVVVYNNEKYIEFSYLCDNIRNPLNICLYQGTKEIFGFVDEDFTDATPCDGNCD